MEMIFEVENHGTAMKIMYCYEMKELTRMVKCSLLMSRWQWEPMI